MGREIKVAGLAIPIPNWCVPVFGILVVLYVAYALLSQPAQTIYNRYVSGTAEESDAAEAYKHFAEVARATVRQDAAGGILEAKLFEDGCMSVSWQSAISGIPPHPHFIRKITIADATAPPAGSMSKLDLSVLMADPAPQPGCLNPHPGPFQWHYGDRNGCWIQVWRIFTDGCTHFQWFNSCNNFWDVNQDGSPKVQWTQCIHR